MHDEMNYIHRDLKPENIVLISESDLNSVKLIDFGLAVKADSTSIKDYPKCGTLMYVPPEQVIKNYAYGKKSDMWAAGIILYLCLFMEHPFQESSVSL